jgi:uroporphyrin-III C-methyltransferase/precorrin-2 dehydrogenase/sirohydrochlorin ferrochelatase
VSGHAEEAYRPILESLAPGSATVVVMMGLGHIEDIATLMIRRGWNASTPAAVLFGASTAASSVWRPSLRELSGGGAGLSTDGTRTLDAPATIVIGEVVKLAAVLGSQAEADEAAAGGQ